MSTHARPLAVRLAAASADELSALFLARGIKPDAPWQDFFDAAEALYEPASIERALIALPLSDAAALLRAAGGDAAPVPHLTALALQDPTGAVPVPVTEQLDGRTLPDAADEQPQAPTSAGDSAPVAERAFTTASRVADMLLVARETPLALLATGSLAAGEKKRLAEAGIEHDADDLRTIAEDAGLLSTHDRRVQVTTGSDAWLGLPFAARWARLATAFREALPAGIRDDGGGWLSPAIWPHAYPWDPSWPDRAAGLHRRARLLGLIAADGSEPAWAAALRKGAEADATALGSLVPAEVDKVFLQNDLTAIAPGPLQPGLEVRLRGMAERDSAQSSSYRFTAESVNRALIEGETEASVLEFLADLSLTGLPQPLSYLVTQTAQRHGLVRVWASDRGTVVTSSDPHLVEAIGIDRGLRPLGLTAEDGMLVSRVSAETVYWAMVDARYPATLVDAEGSAISMRRTPPVESAVAALPSYDDLIARLRERQGPDADAAWLDRELEAAVRAKALLIVEVGMPDGSTRELLLEATGLGGGRLRGLDRGADVERTLPVRSIRAVRLADVPTPG
ncbi:helicase-associated domain-containing protein [Microbacterium sp. NPDC057659]|uniref:helicase-associated domain-containing protein n=1 Tax=Microbacterium sp. NPDC057659 TaxID=3346198 RepID=UPI0036722FCB